MPDDEINNRPDETSENPRKGKDEQKEAQPSKPAKKALPQLVNPIMKKLDVHRFDFLRRRLSAESHVARVFVKSSGNHIEYPPDQQPTMGELLWGGMRTMYEVDLGMHVVQIEDELPSRGDRVHFRAVVDLVWRVENPSEVVRQDVKDVRELVSPILLKRLRNVTRKFVIDVPEEAEAAANADLDDEHLGAELGLRLKVFVRLTMDSPSLEHAAIQRKVDHFRAIIATGDYNQFALQLALKPEDIGTVVKVLVNERDSHRQAVFDFVTRLLESDALDRWQIDDQVRTTLQWLRDSGHKVLAGSDEARSVTFGESYQEPIGTGNGTGPR